MKTTKLIYTGETGQVRINERPIEHGELVEHPDDDVAALTKNSGIWKFPPADHHIRRKPGMKTEG